MIVSLLIGGIFISLLNWILIFADYISSEMSFPLNIDKSLDKLLLIGAGIILIYIK